MKDIAQILIRKGLTALAGILIAHHVLDAQTTNQLMGMLLPAILLIVSYVWEHCAVFAVSKPLPSPKALGVVMGFALLASLSLTGCVQALRSDKIVSVKQRCFGLVLETTSATTQTPNVKLGFCSTVWQMIPTCTNAPIYAPLYMDTFDLGQSLNPFGTDISENTGAGAVSIGTNGEASAFPPK